jgi:hypothetical protein
MKISIVNDIFIFLSYNVVNNFGLFESETGGIKC